MPTPDWIAAHYRRRDVPEYPHQPAGASHKQWQPEIYGAAGALAARLGCARIVDLGCGSGTKLIELAREHATIGIDRGDNLARARAAAPELDWRDCDLQAGGELPLAAHELAGSLVISADVIEHLPDPHVLLAMLRAMADRVELILVSTPERHLTRGLRDPGPPRNAAHVQEWTAREFGALLRACGLATHSLGLIRSHDHADDVATIFVAITRDAERLAEIDRALIDLEVPAAKSRLATLLRR